jgi:hypothetical protein
VKRVFEHPRRSQKIFFLVRIVMMFKIQIIQDFLKQIVSTLLIHFMNVFLSMAMQYLAKRGNECIWYFVNLVMDTSMGIGMCYLLHK